MRVTVGHHRRVRFTFRRAHGNAMIKLKRPDSQVHVTIGPPSLAAARTLARRARHERGARVKIHINVTDHHHRTTRRTVSVRLRG